MFYGSEKCQTVRITLLLLEEKQKASRKLKIKKFTCGPKGYHLIEMVNIIICENWWTMYIKSWLILSKSFVKHDEHC